MTRWFQPMADAVAARTDLLSAVVSRVSPEYLVVALVLQGLLDGIGTEPFDVRLEHPIAGQARKKCDVVVLQRGGLDPVLHLEVKALWPGGLRENLSGIRKDLDKLRGIPNAYAMAFAYVLSEVPTGFRYRADGTLDGLLAKAREELGAPAWSSPSVGIHDHGVSGQARLVAWQARTKDNLPRGAST